jgi:two-component system chemotaxis response regulator CheY
MSKRFSVLVVNDKPYIRSMFLSTLGHSYDCLTASGPDDAASIIRATHLDLIITEATLPDCSGLVVLLHANRYCPEARVIVLTAPEDKEFKKFAIENGASGFLHKPFTLWQVEAAVQGALRGKAGHVT